MSEFRKKLISFIRDEEGLTMVEYAVAGGMIVVAGVAAFAAVGTNVDRIINLIDTELTGVQAP
jgi:pilus assembly protein Flp/PilA